MRLLVYGGNEHNIRCEIGSWDLADKGPLFDTYGIPKDGWMTGFGILNDQGFLFLKTNQTSGARTYPFTILLDPGEAGWKKFGWNAAHLAFSLTNDDNQYREDLLNNPESFRIEKLEAMVQALRYNNFDTKNGAIAKLIAGSVFENEPISVNPLNVNPSIPALPEIVSHIEALPVFLRTGNGWLFGGSSQNAEGLGIKLVFDANLQTLDEEKIERMIQKGDELLESLKTEEKDDRSKLAQFSAVPSWRWESEFKASAAEVLTRISNLRELEKRSGISDTDLQVYDEKSDLLFADDERRIILDLACRANGVLTPSRTVFLLKALSTGELPPERLPGKYLHPETYKKWLVENRMFPSESPLKIQLDSYDCFEVCRDIIMSETNPNAVPSLFQKSINELRKHEAGDFIENLAEAARVKTAHNLYEVWFDYREKDFFKEYLAPKFEKTAREAAKNKHPEWMNIYLRFANDDGGHWLLQNTSVIQARLFIQQLAASFAESPNGRGATAWFQALTTSPLRNELTNEEKSRISRLNNQLAESWRNFTTLKNLLEGKNNSVRKLDSPAEAIYLHRELGEFLKENTLPDLKKLRTPLKTFFGDDPDEFVNEFNRQQKEILEKGKQAGAARKAAEQETTGDKRAATKNEIILFDENKIAAIKPLVDEISAMMQGALGEETTRERFVNNFTFDKHSPVFEAFPYLPLTTRANVLQLLYDYRNADLKTEVQKFYKENQYSAFALALWECILLTETGRKIKEDLLRMGVSVDVIDARLKEHVERSVDKAKWTYTRTKAEDAPEPKAIRRDTEKSFWDHPSLSWILFWKKWKK